MNWMRTYRVRLLVAFALAIVLAAIGSSLAWSDAPLPMVAIGLPFGLALYAGNKKVAYVLLGLAALAVLAGLCMIVEQHTRLAAITELCDRSHGTILVDDFQYICLNGNQETDIFFVDMFSGWFLNWGVVLYGGIFLVSLAYLAYRSVRSLTRRVRPKH